MKQSKNGCGRDEQKVRDGFEVHCRASFAVAGQSMLATFFDKGDDGYADSKLDQLFNIYRAGHALAQSEHTPKIAELEEKVKRYAKAIVDKYEVHGMCNYCSGSRLADTGHRHSSDCPVLEAKEDAN